MAFDQTEAAVTDPVNVQPDLEIGADVAVALAERLPSVAEQTVAAVILEVPGYADTLGGEIGAKISGAVEMALLGFLKLAARPWRSDPGTPLRPALDAAYALGRGEARSGRSVDALLAAYRVGARVAWRELAGTAATAGMQVLTMARFADLMFAYIDELSAASVAGHTDELSTTGRVRERYLERLGRHLLAGAGADVLTAAAERADWPTPNTLTAVLLPLDHARGVAVLVPADTLRPREEPTDLEDSPETVLLLVPDAAGTDRRHLLRALSGRQAVVGPARPWMRARSSYLRAAQTRRLPIRDEDRRSGIDTEQYLSELVLSADPDAREDLRVQVLAPLAGLRPATADRLAQTLRSWLLHQGRRDDVAADLCVHAQTVRYRMNHLRELFGDRLRDPGSVLDLIIALGPIDRSPLPASATSPPGPVR